MFQEKKRKDTTIFVGLNLELILGPDLYCLSEPNVNFDIFESIVYFWYLMLLSLLKQALAQVFEHC